jgi:hypothetical protein
MPLLTGSVRSIQIGLELLLVIQRSVGHISQTLRAAGAATEAHNSGLRVPLPVLGEADEIFVGRKPCFTVVDGRSFPVLKLAAAESRDANNWGLTFPAKNLLMPSGRPMRENPPMQGRLLNL